MDAISHVENDIFFSTVARKIEYLNIESRSLKRRHQAAISRRSELIRQLAEQLAWDRRDAALLNSALPLVSVPPTRLPCSASPPLPGLSSLSPLPPGEAGEVCRLRVDVAALEQIHQHVVGTLLQVTKQNYRPEHGAGPSLCGAANGGQRCSGDGRNPFNEEGNTAGEEVGGTGCDTCDISRLKEELERLMCHQVTEVRQLYHEARKSLSEIAGLLSHLLSSSLVVRQKAPALHAWHRAAFVQQRAFSTQHPGRSSAPVGEGREEEEENGDIMAAAVEGDLGARGTFRKSIRRCGSASSLKETRVLCEGAGVRSSGGVLCRVDENDSLEVVDVIGSLSTATKRVFGAEDDVSMGDMSVGAPTHRELLSTFIKDRNENKQSRRFDLKKGKNSLAEAEKHLEEELHKRRQQDSARGAVLTQRHEKLMTQLQQLVAACDGILDATRQEAGERRRTRIVSQGSSN